MFLKGFLMNETCKSCGTVFHLDKNILSDKILWLKCSVCEEKWSLSSYDNKKSKNILKDYDNKSDIDKVQEELASIKLVVENKSKQLSDSKNSILELKNKSVAEIAAELSASKLKIIQSEKEVILDEHKKNAKIKQVKKSPLFLFLILLFLSLILFYRSSIISYSFIYFPLYAHKYSQPVNKFLNLIKLPILAETKYLKIIDFGATIQANKIEFFGFLQNNSSQPVMSPKIKVLAVTEDGKILLEKIILINNKVLKPYSKIKFKEVVNVDFDKENISIRASVLKEIFKF